MTAKRVSVMTARHTEGKSRVEARTVISAVQTRAQMKTDSISRRTLLGLTCYMSGLAALPLALPTSLHAAPARGNPGTTQRMVQLVDSAAVQQELARDYTTGLRLAWAQRTGGANALPQLVTVPVDLQRANAVPEVLRMIGDDPSVVATVGMTGDALAVETIAAASQAGLRLAHIGPWMADGRHDNLPDVLTLFPSRSTQLRYAVTAVKGMGIDRIAIVYPSQRELTLYAPEINAASQTLSLKMNSLAPAAGDSIAKAADGLAEQLARQDSGLVLFVGASAELATLSQAMAKRGQRRFLLSLSDVDHATLQQMRLGSGVPLILTQVVPNPANSTMQVAVDYRATLKRLYDEAPSPLSLAGMITGLCALELYRRSGAANANGPAARAAVLTEVQRRTAMDLGGFRLDFAGNRRGSGYVTHTLLRADGSLLG